MHDLLKKRWLLRRAIVVFRVLILRINVDSVAEYLIDGFGPGFSSMPGSFITASATSPEMTKKIIVYASTPRKLVDDGTLCCLIIDWRVWMKHPILTR